MRYRAFILQNYNAVTLALLRKLKDLVQQGMILVGTKPERSAGLSDYSGDDKEFRRIADELWGNINGIDITNRNFGKGRVFQGRSLESILRELRIKPDFEYSSRSGDAPVLYVHRNLKDADIYFLSNQRRTYEELVCTFRVKNKQPELWDAVTGNIIPQPVYEWVDEHTRLPVQLEPYGSVFVVFRSPVTGRHLLSVEKDDKPVLSTKNFSKPIRRIYKDITGNFTISFWAKPEINILLEPQFIMGSIKEPWTEHYALYPPPGHELYGEAHATAGITVGRNGVAVWEHAVGNPVLVLAAPVPVSGWSHITIVYNDGSPSVYVNGQLVEKGKKSKYLVHPAIDEAFLNEGASYYNGDMSRPVLFTEVLSDDRIRGLVATGLPLQSSSFIVEIAGSKNPSLLIKQNGSYVLTNSAGKKSPIKVSDIDKPVEIKGAWQVNFPDHRGVPTQILLPDLISLHKHPENAVKYFSGTALYTKNFIMPVGSQKGMSWLLDLGRVEVIAEVSVNGKNFGILWKRPYRVDITDVLKEQNKLEIKITNLWPNRLIGDEYFPNPDKFTPGGGASGLQGLTGGGIEKLPDWYIQGKPKPVNGRTGFTTWQHYTKDSPLLESGLIGPVLLQPAKLIGL